MLRKICIAFIAVEVVLFGLISFARTISHYKLDFSLASASEAGSGTSYDHDLGVGDFSLTFNCDKSGTWESTFSTGTHNFTDSFKGRQLKLNLENGGPGDEKCHLQAIGHLLPSNCSCFGTGIPTCDCPYFGSYTVLNCGETLKADYGAFLLNVETHDGCL
ncbi:MAG: hypothetical protein ABSC63_10305 [Candidatus Binataceae bacterium]|jgi:uncharacterized protein involved in high-affinity Fe2+ transport